MKRKWFDKKVVIAGLSKSGIAAAKYLNAKGANCYLTEFKPAEDKDKPVIEELEKEGIHVETGGHGEDFIKDAYLAVMSPGIAPHKDIYKMLKANNVPFVSEPELAYSEVQTPFIAVTGTNGKTTVTSLISHILNLKYDAPACGNIGLPPISLIDEKHDFLVCEMSSYQCELSPSFTPFIACFLNWSPNHVDWHEGEENYFKAKAKLFAPYKQPAFAIFNAINEKVFEFGKKYEGTKYFFGKEFDNNCCFMKDGKIFFKNKKTTEEIIDVSEINLPGEHNLQNVMCAVIAAKICGVDNETLKEGIKTFKAVEHRIEFCGKNSKHKFYNDSKSTTPEATIVAVRAFNGKPITLIAGGRDKNTTLEDFCKIVKEGVNKVILLGEAADRFEENLKQNGFENILRVGSLEEAIDKADEGDDEIILFSPACASFDMFDNFEHRGEKFKEYVAYKTK